MMDYVLADLQPQNVFHIFEEISRIPRGSGNEGAVGRYVAAFAAKSGYPAVCDDAGNVAVHVPASSGMEQCGKLILQAHMDMVCEKEAGSSHDFLKDPIALTIEDGFVKARGTTLGADDGIGMALALAVLEDKSLRHPAMEFLFTAGEEILFQGAKAMDKAMIDGDALIGLDCSRDDIIMVSCAGISIHQFRRKAVRTPLDPARTWQGYDLAIQGLAGGHSAYAIAENRGNGVLLLGRILEQILALPAAGVKVLSLEAGTLINVIPAMAKVSFCCGRENRDALEALLQAVCDEIGKEYALTDPGLRITWKRRDVKEAETALGAADVKGLLHLLAAFPNGVHTMQARQPEKVEKPGQPGQPSGHAPMAESSACVSILREEDGVLTVKGSIRSNVEGLHDHLEARFAEAARQSGFQHIRVQREPAWEYQKDSKLKDFITGCWEAVKGETPGLFLPHASVECAVFIDKMAQKGRKLDAVGIGCRTLDVHTPRERLEIASVGKTYRLLTYMVEHFDLRYS